MTQWADIVATTERTIKNNDNNRHALIIDMMVTFMGCVEFDKSEIIGSLDEIRNATVSTDVQVECDKQIKELKEMGNP